MAQRDTGGMLSKVARLLAVFGLASIGKRAAALFAGTSSAPAFAESGLENEDSAKGRDLLRELMERRRRNDFVRQREFDQLRRQRRMAAVAPTLVETDAGLDSEPGDSSFLDTAIDNGSEERAMTLRKIDEIEEQMSRQWWKTRPSELPEPAANTAGGNGPADQGRPQANENSGVLATALPSGGVPAPKNGQSGFAATALHGETAGFSTTGRTWPMPSPSQAAMVGIRPPPLPGDAVLPFSHDPRPLPAAVLHPDLELPDLVLPGAEPHDASLSQLMEAGPGPLAGPLPALPGFEHQAALEEAAIEFANADITASQASLSRLIDAAAHDTGMGMDIQREYWHTLFDLYRAVGQRDAFEISAIAYAERFSRSPPAWVSLVPQATAPAAGTGDFHWRAPLLVGAGAVTLLNEGAAASTGAWWLDWSGLEGFEYDSVAPLLDTFTAWRDMSVRVYFEGAERLLATLEARTLAGAADAEADWWRLRMETLRLLGRMDEYEEAALDYCITYEVSPPSWQSPLCDCRALPIGSYQASLSDPLLRPEASLAPGGAEGASLAGEIGSDVGSVLSRLDALIGLQRQQPVPGREELLVIDCTRLVRLDFVAAGSVLGWTASRHGEGLAIEFRNLHRLVGIFFNVTGISEYARVYVRSD
jgi:hypothetical protein